MFAVAPMFPDGESGKLIGLTVTTDNPANSALPVTSAVRLRAPDGTQWDVKANEDGTLTQTKL
jgi:hypothetical protein